MTKNATSELTAAVAEIIDPAPFNRGAVNRTPDQIKWDLNRENKALRKAERIINYLGFSVIPERKCKGCGCDITHKSPLAKYHSTACRKRHGARNYERAKGGT